jgi:pimeloyl-ACP methyl ester carboxylesterase
VIVDWHVSTPSHTETSKTVWQTIQDLAVQYQQSVEAARSVGVSIACWMTEKGISPARVVLCGHSLGAQIAAFASQQCAQDDQFGQRVKAILAADPAGPLFSGQSPENRLDAADADEVIVIHTTDFLGDKNAVGSLDFYIQWPASESVNEVTRHSEARELLTDSFERNDMRASDGTPFGANALGLQIHARGPIQLQFAETLAQSDSGHDKLAVSSDLPTAGSH